jgi:UDP-N-acetylglucosamine 4,6-dehydratase|tara:strand:+ start:1280 stop:2191 length:912 start_codon:yes stop_codon:yes gene_type:complete
MKKVLIVGGSGTIGSAFIKEFYNEYEFSSISRNELMQAELKRKFPKVDIYFSDIESQDNLTTIFLKVKPDIVIHMAAMKHVNLAEENPINACRVNVLGSLNVVNASIRANVPTTIAISTDKACFPENVYGYSKSLMEHCFHEANTSQNKFAVCRFANVANTTGSVIPFWLTQRKQNQPLKLTDKSMNRLMFSQKSAVNLINNTINYCEENGGGFTASTFMKSVNMYKLAKTISDDVEIVGLRPGERLNEKLMSKKELPFTYIENDLIVLKKQINKNDNKLTTEYSSETAEKMSDSEILELIEE